MEDSFRVRVDKAFGLLASLPSSTSPSLSSPWRLTDEEIERREWNRDRGSPDDTEPKPYPAKLDGFFASQRDHLSSQNKPAVFHKELEADLQNLNNDPDDDDNTDYTGKQHPGDSSSRQLMKLKDHGDEAWDIRSSIGLDCTLDYEEEEDEYDKVAAGREEAGDRLYMRDITGCGTDDLNFYDELPDTFKDVKRDPRANHMAAKLRLKEDAEAAGKFDCLRVSDMGPHGVSDMGPHGAYTQNNTPEECVNPKSILKRKEDQTDMKSQKRVRFDSGCKAEHVEESEVAEDEIMKNCMTDEAKLSEASFLPQKYSGIPDYVRNPSKYTHYTFDSSSDIDEESNQKSCMDFLNQLKRSKSLDGQVDVSCVNLPKSITFAPKKKVGDALKVKDGKELEQNQQDAGKELVPKKGWPIGIAAEEALESEVCAMEEDEPVKVAAENGSSGRHGRRYRKKANIESEEPVT